MDIFGHCTGFLSLYLYFTAGIDMARFECVTGDIKSICVPVCVYPLLHSGWESNVVLLTDIYSLSLTLAT